MNDCTCPFLNIGMKKSESRNWDPDCPEHGLKSDWWSSPEQVEKRARVNKQLNDLRRATREIRDQGE